MSTIKPTHRKSSVKKASALGRVTTKTLDKYRIDHTDSRAWEKMQVLTEHWQSDLKFFQDEIRFLHNLINKYFLWLMEGETIQKTKQLASELNALETKCKKEQHALMKHLQHYHHLFENTFSQDSQKFMEEHAQLESAMASLLNQFRTVKRTTFALTEQVLESEKVKHFSSKG